MGDLMIFLLYVNCYLILHGVVVNQEKAKVMSTSCRIPWIVSYSKNSLSFLWQSKNLLTIYLTIPFCVRVHFWNQEIWIKGIFIEPFEKLLLKEQLHSAANFEDRWYKRTLPFKYIRSLHGRDIGGTIFFLRLSFDKSKQSCEKMYESP